MAASVVKGSALFATKRKCAVKKLYGYTDLDSIYFLKHHQNNDMKLKNPIQHIVINEWLFALNSRP